MTKEEIREGDVVEIDYIEEFTGIHRKKGKALVLWKGLNNQPLITLLEGKYSPKWSCYEYISKVIGHISLEEALEQQPCEDAISRLDLRDAISNLNYWHANQYGELRPGGGGEYATVYKANDVERMADTLPSVTPKDDVLDKIRAEIEEIEKNYRLDKATKYGNKNAEQQNLSYSTMMMYEVADITDEIKDIIDKYKADKGVE